MLIISKYSNKKQNNHFQWTCHSQILRKNIIFNLKTKIKLKNQYFSTASQIYYEYQPPVELNNFWKTMPHNPPEERLLSGIQFVTVSQTILKRHRVCFPNSSLVSVQQEEKKSTETTNKKKSRCLCYIHLLLYLSTDYLCFGFVKKAFFFLVLHNAYVTYTRQKRFLQVKAPLKLHRFSAFLFVLTINVIWTYGFFLTGRWQDTVYTDETTLVYVYKSKKVKR